MTFFESQLASSRESIWWMVIAGAGKITTFVSFFDERLVMEAKFTTASVMLISKQFLGCASKVAEQR